MSGVVGCCNQFITILTSSQNGTSQVHSEIDRLTNKICTYQTTNANPLTLCALRDRIQDLAKTHKDFADPIEEVVKKLNRFTKTKSPEFSHTLKSTSSSSSFSPAKWIKMGVGVIGLGYLCKNVALCLTEGVVLDLCNASASTSSTTLYGPVFDIACKWLGDIVNEDRLKHCTHASADITKGLLLTSGVVTLYAIMKAYHLLRTKNR